MSDKGLGAAAGPDALPPDYDSRPSRFRVGSESAWKFGEGDVHEDVAERIAGEQAVPVLDLGCGEGRLMRLLIARSVEVVGLDQSPTMLKTARGKRVLGDARTLPFRAASFGVVAALYFLYHLSHPEQALREAHRVLQRMDGRSATITRYACSGFNLSLKKSWIGTALNNRLSTTRRFRSTEVSSDC